MIEVVTAKPSIILWKGYYFLLITLYFPIFRIYHGQTLLSSEILESVTNMTELMYLHKFFVDKILKFSVLYLLFDKPHILERV